jgi:hypothetical protein
MFLPRVGGKRVYPSLVVNPRRPSCSGAIIIEVRDAPGLHSTGSVMPAAAFEPVGPIVRPLPVRGVSRFNH